MSVLYRTLRRVFDVAVELYFVDIRVTGASKIPESGPVVFAANHPNSIMDTVLLGTQIDRQIHYLAKSELFANRLLARVFDACGVIPLHRNPAVESSNTSAFRSAFDLLGSGRCLGIFPEGQNSPERGVLELKTGVARIALGAEREHDGLGVRVVPVGLNFEQRDRFLSRVVIRVGDPIEAREFTDLHRRDERAAVRKLTDRVAESLDDLVTTMADDRARALAEQVDDIYGGELLDDAVAEGLLGPAEDDPDDDGEGLTARLMREIKQFDRSRGGEEFDRRLRRQGGIAKAIGYYDERAPDVVQELEIRVQRYLDHLEQAQIRSDLGDESTGSTSRRREALKLTAYAVAFALPAGWGLVHNAIPYNLMRFAALQAPDEPMRAFTGLLSGLVVFSVAYGVLGWAAWSLLGFGVWSILAYLASLPVSGFFFLRYRRQVLKYRNRILARTFALTRKGLIEALVDERRELVEAFERLREHYRAVERGREEGETPPPVPDLGLSPWWEFLRET